MRPLDRTDAEIVAALQKNARLSNKELAARLGIAQSTCLERVRRLVAERVLRGFHADVDPAALGVGLEAIIAIRLAHHHHDDVERFRDHAASLPEVRAVYHMAGIDDFLVHVAVRDIRHLRELGMEAFTTRPEVDHLTTSVIFEHVARYELPLLAEVDE